MACSRKLTLVFVLFTTCIYSLTAQTNPIPKPFQQWAKTPPMGWNSWDCYGPTVTEAEVKANADYMGKYLKKAGWEYIVVDIRWYVANDKAHGYNEKDPVFSIDAYGRFLPAVERFPSSANGKGFKPLADYIHSKGLKFGIHIMRGVPVVAVKRNLPILGTKLTAANIYSEELQCKWLKDMYTIVHDKEGAQAYYNSLFQLYASWGVDFVKVDDLSRPYHTEEVAMIRKAIDLTGRKILLSTSPGETPIASAPHVQQHANMWRTVDDFWDKWDDLKDHFKVFAKWNQYRVPGGWPDGDMLPLGHIGIRAERGNDRMTKFTRDEQYTLLTLWSIFRSPLMFGGDLPTSDSFTLALITNKEVLDVLKNSSNNKELFNYDEKIGWIADAGNGDKYLAVFNSADKSEPVNISVTLKDLGIIKSVTIHDLWTGKNLGSFNETFAPYINRHGAGLYRISVNKK
jgi:alpha-galactosidase